MKVLVLCAAYPNLKGSKALNYVHVRNKYYLKEGIVPVVLNFSAKCSYEIDGVEVITLKEYQKQRRYQTYTWLICHAPNIRNHYLFLKKYQQFFPHIMFVFHGHEIVKINEAYPPEYDFLISRKKLGKKIWQNIYDNFKLRIWRIYLPKIKHKSQFIFVSKSLYSDFKHYVGDIFKEDKKRVQIIYNSVGRIFEKIQYKLDYPKEYDFITIRSNLDSSVYCLDLVTSLARKNPEKSFLVIGKGEWFTHYEKPQNIILIHEILDHDKLIELINKSRFALMPTRRDSQGVMTCELMTFGIPVITSDITVCREICDGFDNYMLINNNDKNLDLELLLEQYRKKQELCTKVATSRKYFSENTIRKEVCLLFRI